MFGNSKSRKFLKMSHNTEDVFMLSYALKVRFTYDGTLPTKLINTCVPITMSVLRIYCYCDDIQSKIRNSDNRFSKNNFTHRNKECVTQNLSSLTCEH
jgi:hypothetical protein